jgi:hypothetical protein
MSNVKLYQSGAVIHLQGHIKLHFLTGAVMNPGTLRLTKLLPFPANLNLQGRSCRHPSLNVTAVPCSVWRAATLSVLRLSSNHGDHSNR